MERDEFKDCVEKLKIGQGSIVSVIGSGGKTTLIQGMARILAKKFRVALATSVKIYCPLPGYPVILKESPAMDIPAETSGVYYVADELLKKEGKLHGFSREMLLWTIAHMDVILIEADGSRRLPLKGWAEHEPVVLPQTQITIGVLPVSLLGKKIGPAQVHRWDRFCSIAQIGEGDALTAEHLIQVITSPEGLFGKAVGKKVLYLAQIATEEQEKAVAELKKDRRLKNIDCILAGRAWT